MIGDGLMVELKELKDGNGVKVSGMKGDVRLMFWLGLVKLGKAYGWVTIE